jgi:hypothetical protein
MLILQRNGTFIPACQDMAVTVCTSERDEGSHRNFHLAIMCASSVPEIVRCGFTYPSSELFEGAAKA